MPSSGCHTVTARRHTVSIASACTVAIAAMLVLGSSSTASGDAGHADQADRAARWLALSSYDVQGSDSVSGTAATGDQNATKRGSALLWSNGTAPTRSPFVHPAPTQAPHAAPETPEDIARTLVINRGWTVSQWECLENLWTHESHFRVDATNPKSGAYGIPQALPAKKMAMAGDDWRTNPRTQIRWGLDYITARYETPCGAWKFWRHHVWY